MGEMSTRSVEQSAQGWQKQIRRFARLLVPLAAANVFATCSSEVRTLEYKDGKYVKTLVLRLATDSSASYEFFIDGKPLLGVKRSKMDVKCTNSRYSEVDITSDRGSDAWGA